MVTVKLLKSRKRLKKSRKRFNKKVYGGDPSEFTIMSYNVLARGATHHMKNKHRYLIGDNSQLEHIEQSLKRYNIIKDEIKHNNPDVVLLQEVDSDFFNFILEKLTIYEGYFHIFIPQKESTERPMELSNYFGTAIIWNKDKFKTVFSKTLDSSEYMKSEIYKKSISEIDGGGKKDVFGNKNATIVSLKVKDENLLLKAKHENLIIVSLHLSGDINKSNKATPEKILLLEYVLDELNKLHPTYIVIGGDFNCPFDKETECKNSIIELLKKNGYLNIGNLGKTTCSFDYVQEDSQAKFATIDTMFYKGLLKQVQKQAQEQVQEQVQKQAQEQVQKQVQEQVQEQKPFKSNEVECINIEHPYEKSTKKKYSNVISGSDHFWIMQTFKGKEKKD
jgi:exonuclease III